MKLHSKTKWTRKAQIAGVFTVLGLFVMGCSSTGNSADTTVDTTAAPTVETTAPAPEAIVKKIAILTPGAGNDFSWNQQGIDSAKAAAAAMGIEIIVADNLGYGNITPNLRELADQVELIIAHASGYNTAAPEVGAEFNKPVAIVNVPTAMKAGLVADYTASPNEGAYLAGVLAAKMTRSSILGIVVSGEPPSWNSQSAGFADGAKSVNPKIKLLYSVIGPAAYSDAEGANRVTKTLIAAGADIILGQGDGASFGMLSAIEETPAADGGKVLFIDVIGNKTGIDKGFLLSSVLWDYTSAFVAMIKDINAGTYGSKNYGLSLADGSISLLKTPLISDKIWAEIEDIKAKIVAGALKVENVQDADGVRSRMSNVTAGK